MADKIPCARDCKFRNPTCHVACKAYNEWKTKQQELADKIYRARTEKSAVDGYFKKRQKRR